MGCQGGRKEVKCSYYSQVEWCSAQCNAVQLFGMRFMDNFDLVHVQKKTAHKYAVARIQIDSGQPKHQAQTQQIKMS